MLPGGRAFPGRPLWARPWIVVCALLSVGTTSCAESDNPASVAPSSVSGLTLQLLNVQGNRWAQSGAYLYNVHYSITNATEAPATYSLSTFSVFGPGGETLTGYSSIDMGQARTVQARSTGTGSLLLNGNETTVSQPFAERVRVRMNFSDGGRNGVLGDEDIVLHGPQTARLHDFSMTPPGDEAGATHVGEGTILGQPVTVRWNVEGASLVVLESSLPWAPVNGQAFREEVEHVGSRTFITLREGVAYATLDIDRGRIRKSLMIGVRR